jgi:hypothetical protein
MRGLANPGRIGTGPQPTLCNSLPALVAVCV